MKDYNQIFEKELQIVKPYVEKYFNETDIVRNKKVFVCGLSGSGKDTIANYLRDEHNFTKLRLASTLKNVICETKAINGYDELEKIKRQQPDIRKLHNIIGDDFQKRSSENEKFNCYTLNICYSLITGNHGIYEITSNKNLSKDYIVCDVRKPVDILFLLQTGHYGIFLTRNTTEKVQTNHVTETNIFNNGMFESLKEVFYDRIFLVNNPLEECFYPYHEKYKKHNIADNVANIGNNADSDELLTILQGIIMNKINKIF